MVGGAAVLGLVLAGCARDTPSKVPSTDQRPAAPLVGEPCALSSSRQASSTPPRIFVELTTLEGDLASIQRPSAAVKQGGAAPHTFSQMLADPRWKAISVRYVIASDGTRHTFPWEFGPPHVTRECPTSERWDLSITPHVTGRSPVAVRVDIEIFPTLPPGAAPDSSHVPPECGARTTLVVRDQQLVVLSGFPASAGVGLVTAVTPYVVWEDADLARLVECKGKRANVNVVRSIPPRAPADPRRSH